MDFEDDLHAHVLQARRAWPELDLPDALFVRYLEARTPAEADRLHASDLFLACACAHGVSGSIEAFQKAYEGKLSYAIKRWGASDAIAEEAMQRMREKLFCASPDGKQKITEYSGRASLKSWLTAVLAREVLMLQREAKRDRERGRQAAAHAVTAAALDDDIEGRYLKARYKGEFESAAKEAFVALTETERALLRLHFAEGFTVDRLAALHRIGRSTAARRLAAARAALREKTRCLLCERLRISRSEYVSLCAVVQSDLSLSIGHLLA